jgi:transposase
MSRKSKLTSEQMNRMYDSKNTFNVKTLAKLYGVSVSTVYNVVNKMRDSGQEAEVQLTLDFDKGKE